MFGWCVHSHSDAAQAGQGANYSDSRRYRADLLRSMASSGAEDRQARTEQDARLLFQQKNHNRVL